MIGIHLFLYGIIKTLYYNLLKVSLRKQWQGHVMSWDIVWPLEAAKKDSLPAVSACAFCLLPAFSPLLFSVSPAHIMFMKVHIR